MSKNIKSLQLFLDQRGYSPRTSEAYLFWANRLASHFPDRELQALKPADIRAFFSHLQTKRFKSESIRQATSAIRFLYREICRDATNAAAVPSIKESRVQAKLPTQGEVLTILNGIDDAQVKLILQCIYGMGLELQEARNLKAKNFDFGLNHLRFTAQRTKITRVVALPTMVGETLKQHLSERRPNDFVFTVRAGRPLSETAIQRAWSTTRVKARIAAHANVRSLRHCYVHHLELLGLRLVDVLNHMGVRKDRALAYYTAYHEASLEIPFSPLDRIVHDDKTSVAAASTPYVSETRISQLSQLTLPAFDFTRLVALLNELNTASRVSSLYSVGFLVRAVIDHVPPLFNAQSFNEVVNNYPGTKSFKKNMASLNDALRNVADSYLHSHIRNREDLPLPQQVDFRAQLDHLLGEITRMHKRRRAA